MAKKKPMTKKQYVEAGGTRCPICRSDQIEGESVQAFYAGEATQEVSCLDCHAEWVDCYTLTGMILREDD